MQRDVTWLSEYRLRPDVMRPALRPMINRGSIGIALKAERRVHRLV